MSPNLTRFGMVVALGLTTSGKVMAQGAVNADRGAIHDAHPVKPTGPAAKKADDLIRGYIGRIEKEMEQGRKEVDQLRAELHELIDLRYAMTEAIAELRGELATRGTYNTDPDASAEPAPKVTAQQVPATRFHRDFVYGLGSALPTEPTQQQREQLRRLAPRSDLKRMIERFRAAVEETRSEVDELAYRLLEYSSGVPAPSSGMGGMGRQNGQWFGSIGNQVSMGMGGGMM